MKRWLLSGYFGFGNAGDEAMLASLAQGVKGQVELVVLSAQPERTTLQHGVAAIPRLDVRSLREAIAWADLFVSGPGGIFQDVTSLRSPLYYAWLIHLAAGAGLPVAVYANSVGPLRRRITRWLVRRTLKRARHLSVRDRPSLAMLEQLGFPPEQVLLAADPVLLNEGVKALPPGRRERWRVAVNLRPAAGMERRLDLLAVGLDWLVETLPADVEYFPLFLPDDAWVGQAVRERMRHGHRWRMVKPPERVLDWLERFAEVDFFVGMRLHSLIFAALQGVPALALVYDPKVEGFLEEFRQPGASPEAIPSLPWEGLSQEAFLAGLQRAWEEREGIAPLWQKGLPTLRERARKGLEALLALGCEV